MLLLRPPVQRATPAGTKAQRVAGSIGTRIDAQRRVDA